MLELSNYIPLNLICVVALGALGLRRLVRMEKFHWLRVVIFTGLLWLPVLYCFVSILNGMLFPGGGLYCTPTPEGSNAYTITEM